MEVIADTTLLVDFWRCRSRPERLRAVREQLQESAIRVPWIVKAEFLRGALHQQVEPGRAGAFLEVFTAVWPTERTLEIYADTWQQLAAKGATVDFADLWVAASALEKNLPVVTRNARHFRKIPGLQVMEYEVAAA